MCFMFWSWLKGKISLEIESKKDWKCIRWDLDNLRKWRHEIVPMKLPCFSHCPKNVLYLFSFIYLYFHRNVAAFCSAFCPFPKTFSLIPTGKSCHPLQVVLLMVQQTLTIFASLLASPLASVCLRGSNVAIRAGERSTMFTSWLLIFSCISLLERYHEWASLGLSH